MTEHKMGTQKILYTYCFQHKTFTNWVHSSTSHLTGPKQDYSKIIHPSNLTGPSRFTKPYSLEAACRPFSAAEEEGRRLFSVSSDRQHVGPPGSAGPHPFHHRSRLWHFLLLCYWLLRLLAAIINAQAFWPTYKVACSKRELI